MVKKLSKISLVIGIGFLLLSPNFALAAKVSAPTNLVPETKADLTEVTLTEANGLAELNYDYIAVEFSWDKSSSTEVAWYHIVYWCVENCAQAKGDARWVIQPNNPCPYTCKASASCSGTCIEDRGYFCSEDVSCCCLNPTELDPLPLRVSELLIGGFNFSGLTQLAKYQWQVGACSAIREGACVYSEVQTFTTPKKPAPPAPPPPDGDGGGPGGLLGFINPLGHDTLEGVINALINFLFVLAMGLAPLMIIYAAFLMLTSAGDPEKVSKARQIILWTVVAVAVILLAKGLPTLIKGALGG